MKPTLSTSLAFAVCACGLALLCTAGCSDKNPPAAATTPPTNQARTPGETTDPARDTGKKMTVETVAPLVREYAFREKPKLDPETQFKIEEYEVQGLWQDLKMQLFLVRYGPNVADRRFAGEWIALYHDGKVTSFASAFGGPGLMSAFVMDSNLYYSYCFGSGIHRSHIGRLSKDGREIRIVESGGYASTHLFVRNVAGRIQVEAGTFAGFNSWKAERHVGWLKIKESSLAIVDTTGAEIPTQFGVITRATNR